MAIRNSDGSIILETKVDTSEVTKSTKSIKRAASEMGNAFERFGQKIKSASNDGSAKIMQLEENSRKAAQAVEEQGKKVDELKQKLADLESGKTQVKDSSITKMEADLKRTNEEIDRSKTKLAELYAKSDEIQANAFTDPASGQMIFTEGQQAEFDKVTQEINTLETKLETAKSKANELGTALKTATGQSTQAKISKTKKELEKAEGKLTGLKNNADIARKKLEEMGSTPNKNISALSSGIEKFGKRIAGLAKRVFIFSVITAALRQVRQVISQVTQSDEGFRNSLEALKNSLWAAFTPILNFIIPILKTLINWLTVAVTAVTKFIASLTGKSYSAMLENAKQLKAQSAGYDDVGSSSSGAAKNMKKVTKEAERQRAAFDDLNVLSSNNDTPDTSAGGGGGGIAGGAGGAGASDMNWDFDTKPISEKLAEIMKIVGGALIALGVILLFTGQFGLGLGAIVAGIAVYSIAEESMNDGTVKKNTKTKLAELGQIVGGFLAIIGIILIFAGNFPLGIGALIAGIALFSVSSATLDTNGVKNKIMKFLKDNTALFVGVGIALVVLGIILIVTGVGIPLGLGLIAAGGLSLAAAIAPNWKFITDKLKEIWVKVTDYFKTHIKPWFTKEKWQDLFSKIGTGVKNGAKSVVNGLISIVESGINFIVNKLNSLNFSIPDWVPAVGGKNFGFHLNNIHIPRLATGAVIPPNAPFAAILGDQKRGVNIETPLETMVEAFSTALDRRGGASDGVIENVIMLDGEVLYKSQKKIQRNKGYSFATGGSW